MSSSLVTSQPGPHPPERSLRERLASEPLPDHVRRRVLAEDPGLGALLEGDRLGAAHAELAGASFAAEMGEWDVTPFRHAGPAQVGLLVTQGFLAREVVLQDQVSAELVGPGDVLRPWEDRDPSELPRLQVRWNVLSPCRVLLLDSRFASRLREYPEITAELLRRMHERATRLATTQAISQLTNVDRRLMALFWHVAERWGYVTGEGVVIPLTLSHSLLAHMVGARRPTVTTSIARLAARQEVTRQRDGTWLLLAHDAPDLAIPAERLIPARRKLFRVGVERPDLRSAAAPE
jgi:CRP/FNR family transcriptional regulator, cyclic AMP receptor protein